MSQTFSAPLERAILETLAYSDVFDHPLTLDELHRYLGMRVSKEELLACLENSPAISSASGFYFLPQRCQIVDIRREREAASKPAFHRALFYGRLLGGLPFVRMVSLTGSLAMLNLSGEADMDYLLVTQPGRLWLARAFAVTFGRIMRLFGDRICVNLLLSESALEWRSRDLYSAREMCQMIPITGVNVYRRFRSSNAWSESFLPNASSAPDRTPSEKKRSLWFQRFLERFLRGRIGTLLETWAMSLQMKKITRTYGSGSEANFSADICQGNFHDHRAWTDRSFHERLALLREGDGTS